MRWLIISICFYSFISISAQAADSVFIEELTWVEVRDAIKDGKTTIIFPTGGTEQNGPHMVLGKHNFIVKHAAGEIARRLGNALVAPVLVGLCALVWGGHGALSALYAVALVLVNFGLAAAIVIFTVSSALCGLSEGLWSFTLARVAQGIGGAMMVPVGRLIVLKSTDKRDLVRAITTLTWPALTARSASSPMWCPASAFSARAPSSRARSSRRSAMT